MTPPVVMPVINGAGLGLKREFMAELLAATQEAALPLPDFLELAPENWIGVGGRYGRQLLALQAHYPLLAHGLSLSLGSTSPLAETFVVSVGQFLSQHAIPVYSEHLSWCHEGGQLYELLPIPFTEEAVHHVAARIRRVQEILGRRIALENASYYLAPAQQMTELEFINAVIAEADCDLLLDVNNIHVNSVNHGYDPVAFLKGLPGQRALYLHIAGHHVEAADLLIDTHGEAVGDPVWSLLAEAYRTFGVKPTLLERDFNIPPLPQLLQEVQTIRRLQQQVSEEKTAMTAGATHYVA